MIEKLNVIQTMMAALGASAVAITALEGVLIGRRAQASGGGRTERQPYDWSAFWVTVRINLWRVLVEAIPMGVVLGASLPFGQSMYEHRLWTVPMDTAWGWVAMFFCTEFFYYWMHRAGHRIRWYWASHQVHHSGNQYNLAAAFRQSITGKVTGCFVFFAPQCLFGFSPDAVLISYGLNLVYQFWIHTDLVPKLGWMEGVFNTPSAHRVHHAANVELVRLIEHACDQQTAQTVPHQMQRARTQRITKRRKPARVFREIQPHRWVAVAVHGVAVVFDAPRHPRHHHAVHPQPVHQHHLFLNGHFSACSCSGTSFCPGRYQADVRQSKTVMPASVRCVMSPHVTPIHWPPSRRKVLRLALNSGASRFSGNGRL